VSWTKDWASAISSPSTRPAHGTEEHAASTDLLRQSVYSRIAGYEDVNDAERVSQDPTFRLIGSEKNLGSGCGSALPLADFGASGGAG